MTESSQDNSTRSTAEGPPESAAERGLRIRKAVVGEEYVARAYDRAGEFGRDFQDLVSEYCWGASWGAPRSADATRACSTSPSSAPWVAAMSSGCTSPVRSATA